MLVRKGLRALERHTDEVQHRDEYQKLGADKFLQHFDDVHK